MCVFLIRDKMTNDKMTNQGFEALPQRAKTAHRGSERVASPAVEGHLRRSTRKFQTIEKKI